MLWGHKTHRWLLHFPSRYSVARSDLLPASLLHLFTLFSFFSMSPIALVTGTSEQTVAAAVLRDSGTANPLVPSFQHISEGNHLSSYRSGGCSNWNPHTCHLCGGNIASPLRIAMCSLIKRGTALTAHKSLLVHLTIYKSLKGREFWEF
jgi:hypothetical protein